MKAKQTGCHICDAPAFKGCAHYAQDVESLQAMITTTTTKMHDLERLIKAYNDREQAGYAIGTGDTILYNRRLSDWDSLKARRNYLKSFLPLVKK